MVEWRHWGGRRRSIETDITIPLLPPDDQLRAWLGRIIPQGFTTFKVKVSGRVNEDMTLLRMVFDVLRANLARFEVRLDGNQGCTASTYERMVLAMEKANLGVQLFEQPLAKDDFRGLRRIRRRGASPVILDETVFSAADCRRVIDDDLADGVNVKIAKSGLAQATEIVKLARRAGLKLMIGCMTETMVGLSAGIRLAAGLGVFNYVDLDSIHFLHHRDRWQELRVEGPRFFVG